MKDDMRKPLGPPPRGAASFRGLGVPQWALSIGPCGSPYRPCGGGFPCPMLPHRPDVHARSVAAAAFNPSPARWCTVTSGRTPPDRGGALGSRSRGPATRAAPPASTWRASCARSASTAPWPPSPRCRGRRRTRAAERPARRRVHRRMLATHNIVEVPLPDAAVEAARDLDRALDDATAEYRRARQRLNMFPDQAGPRLGRAQRRRGEEGILDARPLEVDIRDQARGAPARRARVLRHGREVRGVGPPAAREGGARPRPDRPVAPGRRGALLHQGNRHTDGLQARSRGGLLHEVPDGPAFASWCG